MSDYFNESDQNTNEDTTKKTIDYTGPVVPKKKKSGIILLAAGAVLAAGVAAVLIIGPAKVMNSVRMTGNKKSYYKWIEEKNNNGIIDYLYTDKDGNGAYNVTISAAYSTDAEKLSSVTPVELSTVVYDIDNTWLVKLPQVSQDYLLADITGAKSDSLNGIEYFLPAADSGVKSYLKKYVNRLVSESVDSVTLSKNQTFEINGVSVTANKLTATYNISTAYYKLHYVVEEMKIDQKMYDVLEQAGIKKSEFKTLMTNLSDWAQNQATQAEDDAIVTMNCYVDASGMIIGREILIGDENGTGSISYLIQQNKEDTDVYILVGQDEQVLYLSLCVTDAELEEGVTAKSALTVSEYVQKLGDTNLAILKTLLETTGMTGVEGLLGLTEETQEPSASGDTETIIELGKYTGIAVEAQDTTVTDSEVAQELQDFVNYYSDMIEITDRTKVEEFDFVNMDYTGRIDGEEFDGGSDTGSEVQVGSDSFIDGFEDALIGKEVGSTFTFEVTFPDPYTPNEDLSGKAAEFTVTINAIGKRELSDEFVAANTEYSTVEEYRDQIAKELAEEKEYDAQEMIKSDIMTEIIKDCTITSLNEDDVAAERDSMLSTYESYAQMYGVDLETYATYMFGLTLEDFYSEIDYYAEYYVKEAAIIDAIAKAEGISLTDAQYQTELQTTVDQYGYESTEALEESYGKDQLYQLFLQDKVYEFLIDNAELITE